MEHSGHEGAGAVDGVYDPGEAVAGLVAELFAQDAVTGVSGSNCATDYCFGRSVSLCYWVKLPMGLLVFNR